MADRERMRNNYIALQVTAVQGWTAYISEYAAAYGTALQRYRETYRRQEASDKAKIEMIVLALSLAGGTALTAVLGKEALKRTLTETALQSARQVGLRRVLTDLGMTSGKATAEFVAGEVASTLKSKLSSGVKRALDADMPVSSSVPDGDNHQRFYTQFANLNDFAARAGRVAHDLVENTGSISDAEAEQAFIGLRRSQLMRPPLVLREAVPPRTSDRIELAMYLRDILSRDRMRVTYNNTRDVKQDFARFHHNEPITGNPFDRDWGRTRTRIDGATIYRSEVRIDDLGDHIKRRADHLHSALLGERPFGTGDLNRNDLKHAKNGLVRLARLMPVYEAPVIG